MIIRILRCIVHLHSSLSRDPPLRFQGVGVAQNKLELPSTLIVRGAEDKAWIRAGNIA